MSKLILSLVEQRYRDKIDYEMRALNSSLRSEVRDNRVKFRWSSPWTKELYTIEGTIVDASWNTDNCASLTIGFKCPEDDSDMTVVRKTHELLE